MSSLLLPIQTTLFGVGSPLVELTLCGKYANTSLACQVDQYSSTCSRTITFSIVW